MMATLDLLAHSSFHVFQSHTRNYGFPFKIKIQPQVVIINRPFTVSCKSNLESTPQVSENDEDDFLTRVLKENPSQVEPKFLIGDKFYTLKEKEYLSGKKDAGLAESLLNRLNFKGEENKKNGDIPSKSVFQADPIYLNDILREYRGKLYVPDQIFVMNLSEEEEFDRNITALPKMSIGDFQKAIKSEKIKLLTSKEYRDLLTANDCRDFIVDLKEIPGARSLHRTKWALRLSDNAAQSILEEYKGPRYEIEKRTTKQVVPLLMRKLVLLERSRHNWEQVPNDGVNKDNSWVGKLLEYPHPVASSISGRMIVELGMVTAAMAVAAFVVGGILASAIFAVTSFIFATAFYIIRLVTKPFVEFFLGVIFGMLEKVWNNLADFFLDGGVFSKIYEFYTFGGVAASFEVLKPIALVLFTMVLLVRFTLSRRPKNFRKWDLWQGIDFSRSKAEARVDGSTGIKFSDVAGIDEAVQELQELVRYLKNPELFDKMGIKPPHGVLLEGPPGCGKTLVAKAIAGEAGVPFYQMAGSEFVEVLVGVGSARIRDLFKRAKVNKPSVIFIDEIDALAAKRQSIFKEATDHLYNAATQERETTLNQLLIELDGFDTGKGVIFLAATNRRDLLDPALLRPGRFDRKIRIRRPNTKGRLDILKIHASKVKMSDSVDLSACAKNLPGWTGAMLAQLVQQAALVAVRKRHDAILQSDMDEAVDRITVGPKRIGFELGHEARCRRAATEMGVALTSHLLRRYENAEVEPCDRISLVPRGQTLSQVVFNRLDDELYVFERRSQLLHRLQVLLGGRAAEEVIYGRDTSRVSVGYLADASWLARKIVTIWNLENPMVIHGEPPTWSKKVKFVGPRLDFEGFLYDHYGLIEVPLNFKLDDQVVERTEELIRKMYGKTVDLLRRNHAALLKVIKVLLKQAEMSGAEIELILDKYPPQTPWKLLLEEESPESILFFSHGEPDHSDCSSVAAQSREPR